MIEGYHLFLLSFGYAKKYLLAIIITLTQVLISHHALTITLISNKNVTALRRNR